MHHTNTDPTDQEPTATPTRVVLTGASRGLGRALALQWVQHGAHVVAVARGRGDLAQLAAAASDGPGTLHTVEADVGHASTALAARALELLGGVDVLVHNASTLGPVPMPELGDLDPSALAQVFEVNVLGPQRLTHALLPSMLRQRRGLVVGISSDAAVEGYATWGAYGASKAALDQLLKIWDAELQGTGVRAVSIDPGEMDTDMHADAMPDADRSVLARPEDVARDIRALLARVVDLQGTRFGRVDARAIGGG